MPYKTRRRHYSAGGTRAGDNSNYTDINTSGYQTMAGNARVSKDIWIPAAAFQAASAVGGGPASEFEGGSMLSASLNVDVSGSIFANTHQASLGVAVLQPGANVTGSPTYAHATFPVPTDADTAGSIGCRAVWTVHDDLATTGSVFVINAAMTYISSSATARTAASIGACGTYNYTASANFHETDVGDFNAFNANDVAGILTLMHNQGDAADTGGSPIAFLGVKLRYVADSLGASQ